MRKVLFFTVLLSIVLGGTVQAQNSKREAERRERKEQREEKRKEEKVLEAIQDTLAYNAALQSLKEQSFVLEADNVIFRNGVVRYVSSNTNYVAANDGQGTIQTAFRNFMYSPNGLGGVTVQGTISGVRMYTDKDGNVYYDYSIQGIAVSATVSIILTAGTNQASVTINPNFSGNTLIMNGTLVPYNDSNVFQGTTSW